MFTTLNKRDFDTKASDDSARGGFNLKIRALGLGDRSSDDLNNNSPNRRTPTHKQSIDLGFDSTNLSLAAINEKTNGSSVGGPQRTQPGWCNNPKRRSTPGRALKRETNNDLESDSIFLTKTKSTEANDGATGFKNSLTFGTRRNNTENSSHVNAFSDDLPPSKTIMDLQREDYTDCYLAPQQQQHQGQQLQQQNLQQQQQGQQLQVGNTSLLSVKGGDDSGIFGISSNSPAFQRSKNVLPDHLFETGDKKSPIGSNGIRPQQQTLNGDSTRSHTGQTNGESAVLVFGYSESIANEVIAHFAKFGNVLEDFEATRTSVIFHKKLSDTPRKSYPIFTGSGWVKLTYDNKASAIRALEENGSVFHGSMIGCVPYSKDAVENIASVSISNSSNVGETDISLQTGAHHDEEPMLKFASNSHKINLKTDDKIFVKPKSAKLGLYKSKDLKQHQLQQQSQQGNSLVNKVNNWLFGWEDL
ncbi:unnamed protein product [Cyberlindnera jadinii]|uniref:MPPN-domain-containing protein n=1 Tax=Cyberlindnera jadinii (strain ATCC 18201 / CBS 1600 / BCRC 20928 / JCM 3617 / NBRC 0987 / NRRL Y-1542) TaxID=983966 RepID=A0A0H5CA78_CYBJN|nr:MPPN-domain-containing protein [Cyberlindnera jadinii NRRL Y-1542]ODV71507.1 MPPN-domain-containing protein [Cyberlindnera jadinii NRRL Y-1542]CEP25232.1 unnamed protein product [Cyberlindnera jadinii]